MIWAAALALAVVFALPGCRISLSESGKSEAAALASARPVSFGGAMPARMALAGGAIVIAGPKGYCIDRAASSTDARDQAVVVLSACRDPGAEILNVLSPKTGLLTASVAPAGAMLDMQQVALPMQTLFATPQGRAALSRSGQAGSVIVHESFAAEDVYFLRLTDTAPFPGGGVTPDYWRAVLAQGDHVLTVAAFGTQDKPLERSDGIRLLRAFIAAIRTASGEAARQKN